MCRLYGRRAIDPALGGCTLAETRDASLRQQDQKHREMEAS